MAIIWRSSVTAPARLHDWLTDIELVVPTKQKILEAAGLLQPLPPLDQRWVRTICSIPKAWAGYFMEYCSVDEASIWIHTPFATLPPNLQEGARPLLHWVRCLHIEGGNQEESVLATWWQAPNPDPLLLQFMRDCLNQVFPQRPPPVAIPTTPTIHAMTPPKVTPKIKEKEKKLTGGEKARVRAACSLPATTSEDNITPFYTNWVRDGKTKEAARTSIMQHL